MTDLTEQWEKGELPSGEYYIIDDLGLNTTDKYFKGTGFGIEKPQKILAKVPSYDEWQALMDLYKEADVIIKKSDKENVKLKTDFHTLARKLLQVKPELREWLEVNYKEYL